MISFFDHFFAYYAYFLTKKRTDYAKFVEGPSLIKLRTRKKKTSNNLVETKRNLVKDVDFEKRQ